MTIAQTLREAAARLAQASDTPRLDAELLMAHALGVSRSDLLLRHMRAPVLDAPGPDSFAAMLARRLDSEPVAYILGSQDFCGLSLAVTRDVLIPRGDSEVLVEAAIRARPQARTVLDCGTGSGALLLAVLHALPRAHGTGIDRSAAAAAIALANAEALGLTSHARIAVADWDVPGWDEGLGRFDLVLANPPYVEDDAALSPDVRGHEPAGALFAGAEGLDAYRILIPQLPALLAPLGAAFVEIGATQAEAVTALAETAGLNATLHRDLASHPRVLALVHSS